MPYHYHPNLIYPPEYLTIAFLFRIQSTEVLLNKKMMKTPNYCHCASCNLLKTFYS